MKLNDFFVDLMFLDKNGFKLVETENISPSNEFLNVKKNKTGLIIFYAYDEKRSSIHSFSNGLAFYRPDWIKHVVKSEFDSEQRELIDLIESILENGEANEIG